MTDDVNPGTGFVALIIAFSEFAGLSLPDSGDALGLEIEVGSFVARVLPDPSDDLHLLVEIDVGPMDEATVGALDVLHRLNYASRFSHPWTSGIDGGNVIVMYCRRAIAETDAGALEALLGDGIDRATALRTLWESASHSTTDTAADAVPPPGAIRA